MLFQLEILCTNRKKFSIIRINQLKLSEEFQELEKVHYDSVKNIFFVHPHLKFEGKDELKIVLSQCISTIEVIDTLNQPLNSLSTISGLSFVSAILLLLNASNKVIRILSLITLLVLFFNAMLIFLLQLSIFKTKYEVMALKRSAEKQKFLDENSKFTNLQNLYIRPSDEVLEKELENCLISVRWLYYIYRILTKYGIFYLLSGVVFLLMIVTCCMEFAERLNKS